MARHPHRQRAVDRRQPRSSGNSQTRAVIMRAKSGLNAAADSAEVLEGFGEGLAGARVPDPRCVVAAGGDDARAVGSEDRRRDPVAMLERFGEEPAGARVPDARGAVVAPRGACIDRPACIPYSARCSGAPRLQHLAAPPSLEGEKPLHSSTQREVTCRADPARTRAPRSPRDGD